MVIFGSHEELVLEQGGEKTKIKANRIYCSTDNDIKHYAQVVGDQTGESIFFYFSKEDISKARPHFPVHLGQQEDGDVVDNILLTQLRALITTNGNALNLAVMGGLGAGLGDSIVGLETMRNMLAILAEQGLAKLSINVFIRQRDYRRLRSLYSRFEFINSVKTLPIPMDQFKEYHGYWDVAPHFNTSRFDVMPMQDFYLETLGVAPDEIESNKKEPKGMDINQGAKKSVKFRLSSVGRPVLLFHPKSTTMLRDMPRGYMLQLLDCVLAATNYSVITLSDIDYVHPRFFNLSRYSQTFDDYCAFIASADAIISVDTSIYHIAAGYRIPTLAIFSTIPPDLRGRYYPTIQTVLLPGAEQASFYKKHVHHKDTAEQQRQLDEVEALWRRLEIDDVVNRLKKMITS